MGNTCTSLSTRLHTQKDSKTQSERKVYKHFNNIGWSHVKIILINEYYLDNKDQLLREEDNYIQMNKNDKCCLNSSRAFLSEEEKKEYHKQYLEENKEQRKEQRKKYLEENKEQIK